jgi:hypothetical protein
MQAATQGTFFKSHVITSSQTTESYCRTSQTERQPVDSLTMTQRSPALTSSSVLRLDTFKESAL